MSTRDIFPVITCEIKQQSRSWIFRFFALFSLVGIVSCHVYWQGQGGVNWKMVALPCSMPLVNAYLYSVMQSLFLAVMMSEIPRRLSRPGALESLQARPAGNTAFYWGIVTGNLVLFGLVNVTVISLSIFLVNLTSLAPVGWGYYLFYLLTLNLPSWLFVAGFSLWVSSVSGSRYLAISLAVAWLIGSLFWLPYFQHGTLDYTGSGVPNLFSWLVGHVNLSRYLLHRSIYTLVGLGFLAWGVKYMRRLPNRSSTRNLHASGGILLVLAGLGCGVLLEYSHYRDRSVRSEYRSSFERNWREETCRVRRHAIRLRQTGKGLKAESDLLVYNPGKRDLNRIVLFLNPGLRVLSVKSGDNALSHDRDGQFVLIDRSLAPGDTLSLRLAYEGKIDDRYCDLHLSSEEHEDVFHGDRFFPTGRRGAFTGKNFLLLTPACTWYPVAIPPVNPFMPLATGRDFTLFTLIVENPSQQTILSQGVPERLKNGIRFTSRNPLNGISLYGANVKNYNLPVDKTFGFHVNLTGWGERLKMIFSGTSRDAFSRLCKNPPVYWYDYRNFLSMSWYEPGWPYLYLSEVPVSFHLSSHEGKSSGGLVEPGMVFFHERGFDLDMTGIMKAGKVKTGEDFLSACDGLYSRLINGVIRQRGSHPLLNLGRQKVKVTYVADSRVVTLGACRNAWVYSLKYPFMGKVFERLGGQTRVVNKSQSISGMIFAGQKSFHDYFTGRTLLDFLSDSGSERGIRNQVFYMKTQDLLIRLTLHVPGRELRYCLDSLYRHARGEMDYDSLLERWGTRWGFDMNRLVEDWMATRHEQYFKTRDEVVLYDPVTGLSKLEGKIMNAGKTGGVVSIEYGSVAEIDRVSCYIGPGEVKSFSFVMSGDSFHLNTWLSTNRPSFFRFPARKNREDGEPWELGGEWRTIPVEEFLASENENEHVVDDQDAGFELVDGNLTWFQKWFRKAPRVRNFQDGETSRWEQVITMEAEGDSIRGCYCIGGGEGKSTATWRVNLPEAGRYRVVAKVYKKLLVPGFAPPGGVVNHYTVFHGDKKEEVAVDLDIAIPKRVGSPGWASLGEYDFPAGEARVVLSDKDLQKRKDVAIVADAVKWIKID